MIAFRVPNSPIRRAHRHNGRNPFISRLPTNKNPPAASRRVPALRPVRHFEDGGLRRFAPRTATLKTTEHKTCNGRGCPKACPPGPSQWPGQDSEHSDWLIETLAQLSRLSNLRMSKLPRFLSRDPRILGEKRRTYGRPGFAAIFAHAFTSFPLASPERWNDVHQ